MSYADQIESIAQKVNGTEVSLDPILVVTILTNVIPLLVNCFKTNDELTSEQIQSRLVELNNKNRSKLIRRTTNAVMNEHKREQKKKPKEERVELSIPDARQLAVAIIDQAIEADANIVLESVFECDNIVGAEN